MKVAFIKTTDKQKYEVTIYEAEEYGENLNIFNYGFIPKSNLDLIFPLKSIPFSLWWPHR